MTTLAMLRAHVDKIGACTACPNMIGPPTTGPAVASKIMLIGQAPGTKEGAAGKPFAWTAGKTLFRWFAEIGVPEEIFRSRVYMAAVCRCFPGKAAKGGDRVPAPDEIERCSQYLRTEVELLKPSLIIPVGKLAIRQLLPDVAQLTDVVGQLHHATFHGRAVEVVPLPHPSGASTWHHTEPGKTLLAYALATIAAHPAWQKIT